KRVSKDDRPTLVSNLGRLIHQMEPDDRMDLAARVLETKWPKRKRYIRFPDESPDLPARYAASGLDFARIIHQIVGEKARKGLDRTQATIETVYGVLKGTSFRRPSRFQISEGIEGGDAEFFVSEMEKVLNKLADDTDLPEYFQLVSKYPVYPNKEWTTLSSTLELNAKLAPNDLYKWDWYTDEEELQDWIPWWAPSRLLKKTGSLD